MPTRAERSNSVSPASQYELLGPRAGHPTTHGNAKLIVVPSYASVIASANTPYITFTLRLNASLLARVLSTHTYGNKISPELSYTSVIASINQNCRLTVSSTPLNNAQINSVFQLCQDFLANFLDMQPNLLSKKTI